MKLIAPIAAALLLAGLALAQPPTDIKGRQYIFCPCSPGKRGYRIDVRQKLESLVAELFDLIKDLRQDDLSNEQKTKRIVKESHLRWDDCVSSYSFEECVNADASLRLQGCFPNCMSFCEYDRGSWRNSANGVFGPVCESRKQWSSTEQDITSGAFPADVRRIPKNPKPAAEGRPLKANTRPKPTRAPVDATSSQAPQPGLGGDSSIAVDTDLFANPEPPPTPGSPREGCIAVEHLEGLVLQHPQHLRRNVLCSRGFCATPNHAIIVRGRWTSMKHLCAGEWSCVRAVKLVNNLKVAANTRKIVNDEITITPYDLRFPVWAIWLVQMLEDARNLIVASLVVGSVAVLGLVTSEQVRKSM